MTKAVTIGGRLDEIDALDIYTKHAIYAEYLVKALSLKYDFHMSCDDKGIYTKYLWKDLKVVPFTLFISRDNITAKDLGPRWKENGFSSQMYVMFPDDSIYFYAGKYLLDMEWRSRMSREQQIKKQHLLMGHEI